MQRKVLLTDLLAHQSTGEPSVISLFDNLCGECVPPIRCLYCDPSLLFSLLTTCIDLLTSVYPVMCVLNFLFLKLIY